ncbi:MAG: transglutaminase domain-containing protein [Proteobacteria bacterium]|nr:transglutaminase domain-containing protein [Pseudomonadota bacterium]
MKKFYLIIFLTISFTLIICPRFDFTRAETVIIEGRLDSKIKMSKQMKWDVDRPLSELTLRLPLPANYSNKAQSQSIQGLRIQYDPQPASVSEETDKFGNVYKRVVWRNINRDAQINMTYEALIKTLLPAMESRTSFPLTNIPKQENVYLTPTEYVQSNHPEIISLARELTKYAKTEYEAVTAILNFVVDTIKYSYNPPRYDAGYTLKVKSGNCTNIGHLSVALLRASGIPARIVGGISLNKQWTMPVSDYKTIVQKMGQGGHAWIEIYFPDLGWLSYDPQQSRQFTSSRHIKEMHGFDYMDITVLWTGTSYAPKYSNTMDAHFIDDEVNIKPKYTVNAPRSYIASSQLLAKAGPPGPIEDKPVPVPPLPPPPPVAKPPPFVKPPLQKDRYIEFGNMEFPTLVDAYRIVGNRAVGIPDAETAEYATSQHIYAQAFKVTEPLKLKAVSLAMHKFGGDGTIYIDIVSDDNGKPALLGFRSPPVFLENISKKHGYYWVDFTFPDDGSMAPLKEGKYWIVLRRSGEAIMTWFYTPGKPYGGPDDTRSTLKGYLWKDILNYDFVFKVTGQKIY